MPRAASPFLPGGNLKDSLGTTLNGLLHRLGPDELKRMKQEVREAGLSRGIVYEDDAGRPHPTPILLRPRVLGGNQRQYLHAISLVLEGAFLKLVHLWHQLSAVRRILPLTELEQKWMHDLYRPEDRGVLFGRFDASTNFASKDWVKHTYFFEFNPVGVGGTYLCPAVDEVICTHVVPRLRQHAPTLLLEPNDDPRKVLLETLADHARSLRLKRFHIGLCQYKDLPGGVNEFPYNVEFLRSMGVAAWHVDPRELRLKGEEMWYGDHPIDLLYRDHETNDMAAKESKGEDFTAMKHALRTSRCVSSLAGEFDHKSVFQVFTSPEFDHYFSSEERKVFARHVPWTRLVEHARTTDPDGHEVDLLPYLERNRERLLLKPNRSYGGEGILVGPEMDDAAWQAALQRIVAGPIAWVAQGYKAVAEIGFPVIDEDGTLGTAEYFSVLGLFVSGQRLAILGRASQRKVVNVAQKGGLVAVLRLL